MAHDGDAGPDDGADELGVVLVALALHDLGAPLADEARGVSDRLLLGIVIAHVRHVGHPQAELRAAGHALGHEQHFLVAHRLGAFVAEQDHATRVARAQDVDADAVGDDRRRVIVDGQHGDRLLAGLLLHELRNGDFSARFGLLGRFGVKSTTVRVGLVIAKGYISRICDRFSTGT